MLGIEFIRKEKKLSLQELADILNVSRQFVSMWEKGNKKIPNQRLDSLSQYFNLPGEYFQKELTELDKIRIKKIELEKQIDESSFMYEDQVYDDKIGDWVTVDRLHYDEGADEWLDDLKVQEKEILILEKIKKAINNVSKYGFNTEDTINYSLRTHNEYIKDNIKLFNRFTDIANCKNIRIVFLHEIMRAIELIDDELMKKNQIWGKGTIDSDWIEDERDMTKEIYVILKKYMEINRKKEEQNIKDAQELIELFGAESFDQFD